MKDLNVSNIPLNTLYQFDINKYIWTTMLNETRGGKHIQEAPFKVTEVYEITLDGFIKLVTSGKLTSEPGKRDLTREFEIFDYDEETTKSFRIPMRLQELKLNNLYELRDAVRKNSLKNKK